LVIKFLKNIISSLTTSRWFAAGSYSFLSKVLEAGFGLISFFFLVRLFTKEQFGAWVLFISISAVVESLRNAFIYTPLVWFVNNRDSSDKDIIFTSSNTLNLFFTVFTSGILIVLSVFLADWWKIDYIIDLVYVFSITNLGLALVSQHNYIQQAFLSFKGTFYSFLIRKGLLALFIIYCYYFRQNITPQNIAVAQLIIVFFCIPVVAYLSRPFGGVKFELGFNRIRSLFQYGKFTIGTNLSSMLYRNVDSWLLGGMVSASAVAVYNPAIRIANLSEIPIGSISTITYPELVKRFRLNGSESVKLLYEKSVAVMLSIMIPLVTIIFCYSNDIVTLIAGSQYNETVPLLQVTILYGLLIPFIRQFGVVLNGVGKSKVNLLFNLGTAIINLLANLVLIANYGVIGAAYGTFITYFLGFLFSQIYLYHSFGIETYSIARNIAQIYLFTSKQILKYVEK